MIARAFGQMFEVARDKRKIADVARKLEAEEASAKDRSAPRVQLFEQAIDVAEAEYAELWDSWKLIDTKAQATAGTAAAFLAACIALAKLNEVANLFAEVLTAIAVICLTLAILAAMSASRVQSSLARESITSNLKTIERFLAVGTIEVIKNNEKMLYDRLRLLLNTNSSLAEQQKQKAYWLKRSQQLLMGTAVIAAMLAVILICHIGDL
jgi:hypothetical protein